MMCWVALDRACRLAAMNQIPAHSSARWRAEADAIRRFVDDQCWSERRGSYVQSAGSDDVDAGVLLGAIFGYSARDDDRMTRTLAAVQDSLCDGPFVHRYSADDGLTGTEGAFLACSFWLVEALARAGRQEEGAALMDQLVDLANDVGLYAEEADPGTMEFLGNFPQGLSHLALVNAAVALAEDASQ
jgi:GH15 family glucan-1,4-alpha-glucosidase